MDKIGLFIRIVSLQMLLLAAMPSLAQTSDLGQQLEKFNRRFHPERLYVHTDKDFYLAGELAWFKVYFIEDIGNPTELHSEVAYVEILDRESKQVVQAKIPMTKRGGEGSFYLPLTARTDRYIIRAYTNWMKNFGSSTFFEKPISITNTVNLQSPASRKVEADPIHADFYPEGGQMVQGYETRVAFRVSDNNGTGVNIGGVVLNDLGDTVTTVAAERFGMGSFLFTPQAGRQYRAKFRMGETVSITTPLPKAQEDGYVLNVSDNKDGRYKVVIQGIIKNGRNGEEMILLVHGNTKTQLVQATDLRYTIQTIAYIDKSKLVPGINYLTLLNKQQHPVAERLLFIKPAPSQLLNVSLDKQQYTTREAVKVSFAFNAGGAGLDSNNCSVSIFQVDSLQDAGLYNMVNYQALFADLKGEIESPAYFFSSDAGVEEATENLMMTSGWRRFHWENIRNENAASVLKFLPEYRGHLIAGKVISTKTGQPAPNVLSYLSVPSIPYGFYTGNSDKNGMVLFEANNYYGPGEIMAKARLDVDGPYRVEILNPFSEEPTSSSLAYLKLNRGAEDILVKRSIAMQSQNVYRADSLRRFIAPAIRDTLPFYGRAEFNYKLDDYKRFTTMEEVLREYVFPVTIAVKGGKMHMIINNEQTREGYDNNLLVLLDGVALTDYNKILSYDPLKVRRLEVVTRRYLLGPVIFNGIASFETYKGKFDGFDIDPANVTIDYEGLQLHREFYSPDYGSGRPASNRIPDMRTTLQWIPQLMTSANGNATIQFYTSDMKGRYSVVVEGIAADGKFISVAKDFTVE